MRRATFVRRTRASAGRCLSAGFGDGFGGGDGNNLDINTFSGDVHLRLPDSARGELDFNSFSGRFESDLPVTLTNSSRRNFRGALNGGGSGDFKLKTFSGSVSIRR